MLQSTGENKTWEWLRKKDLEAETEELISAAQEQALRTNYVNCNINKNKKILLCADHVAKE